MALAKNSGADWSSSVPGRRGEIPDAREVGDWGERAAIFIACLAFAIAKRDARTTDFYLKQLGISWSDKLLFV